MISRVDMHCHSTASASARHSSAGYTMRSLLASTQAPTSSFSARDTYGQVILEAGASGLPVVAVAEGGPTSLVENRHTGILCRPDADHLAGAVLQLASSPLLRHHLGAAAARAATARTWGAALEQLGGGYRRALAAGEQSLARVA